MSVIEETVLEGVQIGEYTLRTFHHRPGLIQIRRTKETKKVVDLPVQTLEDAIGALFAENVQDDEL